MRQMFDRFVLLLQALCFEGPTPAPVPARPRSRGAG